jgi:hypothetical protein
MPDRPADSNAVEAETYLSSGPSADTDIHLVLEQLPAVTPETAARFGTPPADAFTSLVLGKRVVREAIQPAFTLFSRGDHWMATAAGVLAGVLVRRGVTTPRSTAGLTRSQMHPPGPHLHALLTHPRSRRPDRLDRIDVRASAALSSHLVPPFSSIPPHPVYPAIGASVASSWRWMSRSDDECP